eukprot:SAG22_NODE_1381_length_4544_cov_38.249944_2_plen_78_part_00
MAGGPRSLSPAAKYSGGCSPWALLAPLLILTAAGPTSCRGYQTGEVNAVFKDARFVKHVTDKNWESFRSKFPQVRHS